MRFKQILEEGAKAYLPMYQGIPTLWSDDITNFIEKIEKQFVRKDRVTWFCRWHRIWYLNQVVPELEAKNAREAREAGNPEPEPLVSDKMWRKLLSSISPTLSLDDALSEASDTLNSVREFKHYLDLPIQSIKDVVWEKQTPDELLSIFDSLEKEWQASLKENRAVRIRPQDELLIDFKNGWGWWDLNRGGCRDEGEAMGHCGNGSGNRGDTIISLRKKIDAYNYSPHLTFILNDGVLGEMKGRNNEKPTAKYHKMITALLMSDYVTDIKGGGYMPENNFDLSDLSDDEQEAIKAQKPTLRPAWELLREYEKKRQDGIPVSTAEFNALNKKVQIETDRFGGCEDINWRTQEIIISSRSLNSYTSFTHGIVSKLAALFEDDTLKEMVEEYASPSEENDPANIVDAVEIKYFKHMVNELLPYDSNFHFHAMSTRLNKKDEVEHYIGISDFIYTDEEELEGISTFDEEYDMNDDHYEYVNFEDPIENAIFNYLVAEIKDNRSGNAREVASAILSEYGSADVSNGLGNRTYTPTIPDPRQMEFEFDKE